MAAQPGDGFTGRLRQLSMAPPWAYQVIRYGPGPGQFGELWPPQRGGPAPVAVLIHGGYWRARYGLELMHALAADLSASGWAVWNLEYRRLGMSGGGWPGTFQDVAAGTGAVARLAGDQELDTSEVVVIGHSAGGQLALWSVAAARAGIGPSPAGEPAPPGGPASQPGIRPGQIVSLAGVCDLTRAARLRLSDGATQELLGGEPGDIPGIYARACPRLLLPLGVRQTVVHGTADGHVPFELSSQYARAATGAGDPCTFLPLPGADHFDLIDPAAPAWARIRAQLRR